MAEAFDAWLAEAVKKADIRVNALLLKEHKDEAEAKEAAAEQEKPAGAEPENAAEAAGDDQAGEPTGKVRPPSGSAAALAPDIGKAEEPKLTPDLKPLV